MSYVELIVVLSIFSAVSGIALFNYGDFQARVDIKNLSSDIALKIVEAQKSSLAGLLPPASKSPSFPDAWKPSYGVYFNPGAGNKSFIYFADLDNSTYYDGSDCAGECLSKFTITQNNSISGLSVFYVGDSTAYPLSDLTVSFARPSSSPVFRSATSFASSIGYVQIRIVSLKGAFSVIKLYPSGRVQVN